MEDIPLDIIELSELKLIAAGKKSTEMADELHLSLPAIKWYRQRLKIKFDAATTGELIRKTMEKGMLS